MLTQTTQDILFKNWIKNKDIISYLGLWESVNNPNFKGVEFDTFENKSESNKFEISLEKKNIIISK